MYSTSCNKTSECSSINTFCSTVGKLANCTAEGIDTTTFRSFVAGGTVQGTSGGNPNLLDENGETTSYGIVFTPTYDFLDPFGQFTLSADYIEIMLTDYVTTFALIDFMAIKSIKAKVVT